MTFTREQLEAIRDSAKSGKLPHAFIGVRMVTFDALASQLLTTMDENDRLHEAIQAGNRVRSVLETHVSPAL